MEIDRLPTSVVSTSVFEALERRMLMAFYTRDVAEIETLVDDRCIGVGVTGKEYSKADFIQNHYGKIFVKTFDVLSIKVVEEGFYAVILADWDVDLTVDGAIFKGRIRATRTWARRQDGWKMISFHVSDARLATAWEQMKKK